MKSFSFVGMDIRVVNERFVKLSRCIEKAFPATISEGRIDKLYYEDIVAFKQNNNVVVYWDSFGDGDVPSGIEIRIELDSPLNGQNAIYLISIDKSILSLDGFAKARALKEVFLHEISHLILKHPGAVLPNEDNPASADVLSNMFWSYAKFFRDEQGQNVDAELMSLIIGFWPNAEFTRLVKTTKAAFRQIANEYKMTTESALQLATIMFHSILDVHYLKREEETREILDAYGSVEGCKNVFDEPGTVAGRAVSTKSDAQSGSSLADYECRAYYEDKKFFHDHQSDEVLVIGFKKKCFDAFVRPSGYPEVHPPFG